jgi:hypothetical protein
MLTKPDLKDQYLAAAVEAAYGLPAARLTFLPLGADLASAVYRLDAADGAAYLLSIRPSTVKRHLADLRARSGLTTEQLIYSGRADGWLSVPSLEPR